MGGTRNHIGRAALGLTLQLFAACVIGQVNMVRAQASPAFRVTEYWVTASSTTETITLDQNLMPDYFVMIRGSRGNNNPEDFYMRLDQDPWGTGDLGSSGASNRIRIKRKDNSGTWEGVVTVVESLRDAWGAGFTLRHVSVIALGSPLSGNFTIPSAAAWNDLDQVMLMGGVFGAGATNTSGLSARSARSHVNLWPSGTRTVNWARGDSGSTQDQYVTIMVLEWGDEWTVQRVTVTGSNNGSSAELASHYDTASISPVTRANTWVWGTGYTNNDGTGSSAEGSIVTLGNGVDVNATESSVAVGQQRSATKNFTVYALTHPDLIVDHRFRTSGSSSSSSVNITTNSAAGCGPSQGGRMAVSYNGGASDGTWPATLFSARYTNDTTIQLHRTQTGVSFAAWVQGIQFCAIQTAASVRDMRVRANAYGAPIVEWDTSSEVGTLGYYLRRLDPRTGRYERVHPQLLPAVPGSPQGGIYRFVDPGAQLGYSHEYLIEEIEQQGGRRKHGPYVLDSVQGAAPLDDPRLAHAGAFIATPHAPRPRPALPTAARTPLRHSMLGDTGERALKLGVDAEGWYFVDAATIAEQLGQDIATVQTWIHDADLRLETQGAQVHWLPAESSAGMYFLGQASDSPFARDNVYWIRQAPGRHMTELDRRSDAMVCDEAPCDDGEPSRYLHRARFQENHFAATVVADDPDADYWFWSSLIAGHAGQDTWHTSFDLPHLAPASPAQESQASASNARLSIHLQGASNPVLGTDHRVQVSLNGVMVGETAWDGFAWAALEVTFDADLLQARDNELSVQALQDAPGLDSFVYLDRFELDYPRLADADTGNLWIDSGDTPRDGDAPFRVRSLDASNLYVVDRTTPQHPRRLHAEVQATDTGYLARFEAREHESYLVTSPASRRTPAWLEAVGPYNLQDSHHSVDYLLIAPRSLRGGAQQLADYREREGLRSMVVTVEDIYDAFNHGLPSPHAIRSFLRHASTHWASGPRYVLLVGSGSYDYRDYLGSQDAGLPPWMHRTSRGLFATDQGFADLNDNGLPDLAIGRIPVHSEQAVEAYLAKLVRFEAQHDTWPAEILLVAGSSDAAGNFSRTNEQLIGHLPGVPITRLEREPEPLASVRTRLFEHLASPGGGLLNYVGHGGLDRLGADGILTSHDVATGQLSAAPWLVTATSCVINRFDIPGFDSLGEQLTAHPEGGAVAVWSPSGLSRHAHASLLSEALLHAVFEEPREHLGDAMVAAFQAHGHLHSDLLTYQLLGDPALRLPAEYPEADPDRSDPGGHGDEGTGDDPDEGTGDDGSGDGVTGDDGDSRNDDTVSPDGFAAVGHLTPGEASPRAAGRSGCRVSATGPGSRADQAWLLLCVAALWWRRRARR